MSVAISKATFDGTFNRPARPVDPEPAAALVSFMVAMAAVAATSWAVLAGEWVSSGTSAPVVAGIAGVMEAAILARTRLSRLFAVVAAPVLAMVVIMLATIGTMAASCGAPVDASLQHLLSRYLGAITQGIISGCDWDFTVGLCTIFWLIGYYSGWLALREGKGGLSTVPCFGVLAINALNAPAVVQNGHSANLIAPTMTAACFLILLVAAGFGGSIIQGWHRRRVQVVGGFGPRFVTSASIAVMLAVIAAISIPPLTNTDYTAQFFNNTQHSLHDQPGPLQTGPGTVVNFSRTVHPGGTITSQPTPVLTYVSSNGTAQYLRLVNNDIFSAGDWNAGTGSASTSTGGGQIPRDRNPSDGGIGAETTSVQLNVTYQALADPTGAATEAMFAGEPDAVSRPATASGIGGGNGLTLLTVDDVELTARLRAGDTLTASALAPKASTAELESAGTSYPGFLQPFLQISADGSGNIATISAIARQWTAGAGNPYDIATAIESHLRDPSQFQYSLTPASPPSTSTWPITYFLQTSHTGYCQYFASAMGAMLRLEGIPTRLVSGYGPGGASPDGSFAVTTSDAHVWVEAYFPRYGWIPFEPTPPSELGNYQPVPRGPGSGGQPSPGPTQSGGSPSPRPSGHASSSPMPGGATPTPAPGAGPTKRPASGGSSPAIPGRLIAGIAAVAVIVLMAALTLTWLRRPRTLAATWRRVSLMGRLLGIQHRRSHETVGAYARRVASALPAGTPRVQPEDDYLADAIHDIAVLSGRHEFSPVPLDDTENAQWLSCWHTILRAAPALFWRRMPFRRHRSSAVT